MCILFVHALLKLISYYDLSVLSMSVRGFQKKKVWMRGGCVGGVSSIQCYFGFLAFFNFAKPQSRCDWLLTDDRAVVVPRYSQGHHD